MTFGLRNAAQTFQRFIDEVVRGLDFCYAYLDDIVVASKDPEEHRTHLRKLLQRLQQFGIVINANKCVFGVSEVIFLGHYISANGLAPSPQKVQVIQDFVKPATVKELRRFLGMINFYNKFLPNAAYTQILLQEAIKGHKKGSQAPIEWTPDMETAFDQLKDELAHSTLLAFPDPSAQFAVQTDASGTAIGAVLQQFKNQTWQPLCFFSRRLTPAQCKYSAYDRELLAIYAAIKHFQFMLEGRNFYVLTDHKPLTFAFNQKLDKASPRQCRYLTYISEFTTDIRHVSGKKNVVADTLSRIDAIAMPVIVSLEDLAQEQEKDEELQQEIQSQASSLKLQKFLLPESNSTLFCDCSTNEIRPYVPVSLRRRIFDTVHQMSHPNGRATRHQIAQKFVWTGIFPHGLKRVCNANVLRLHGTIILTLRRYRSLMHASITYIWTSSDLFLLRADSNIV